MRLRTGLITGLLIVVGAGCGQPKDPVQASADGSLPVPTTVAAVGQVGQPCPMETGTGLSNTETTVQLQELGRLEPMLEAVHTYGSQYPDEFGGYGLHWDRPGEASVFASFTDDLEVHAAALRDLVAFPEDLIVCEALISERAAKTLGTDLIAEHGSQIVSIKADDAAGGIQVVVNPTEEALAAELEGQYGDQVDVKVGALQYPIEQARPVCGAPLDPVLIDGLDVRLVKPSKPVAPTAAGSVELVVRLKNTSDEALVFEPGVPTATITDAAGLPVSLDIRPVKDLGAELTVEPGATKEVEVDVSLASCDPTVGYMVPSGEHFVVISLGAMTSAPMKFIVAD